jgi:hypothetical protein
VYAVDPVNPVIRMLPVGLEQAVGLMGVPLIVGFGFTVTFI